MIVETEVVIEKYLDAGVIRGRTGIKYTGMDYWLPLEDYLPNDPRARSYSAARDEAIKTYRGIVERSADHPILRAIPLVHRDKTLIQELKAIGKIASAK